MKNPEPLEGELHEVEEELKSTLEQACATDVTRADTGELIRVEEMLAIATDAAKKAISLRRRRQQSHLRPDVATPPAAAHPTHRQFADRHGVTWTVRAVHPARSAGVRKRLLGEFEHGWLAFESSETKRRLSPIPEDWEQLDDAGLGALCERATLASSRRAADGTG